MKVIAIFLCLLAVSSAVVDKKREPWKNIIKGADCKYERCVEIDFSKVDKDVPSTTPGFSDSFEIEAEEGGEDGTYSCAKPADGATRCLFSLENVNIRNGSLELLVPGGAKTGPDAIIYTSQVKFVGSQFIHSGVFEVVAQTSKVPGTCHGIFTQANPGYPKQKDEQDIEILTGHYTESNNNIKAGLQFTSWAAFPTSDKMVDRSVSAAVDYGFDPTEDFHTYRIVWDKNSTVYSYDSKDVVFDKFSSQNPSKFVINNWSDAGKYWTEGPPKEDNILRIKSFKAYYNTK